MKILVYGINYSPELTGIGKYTGEMVEWLAAQGHEVRSLPHRLTTRSGRWARTIPPGGTNEKRGPPRLGAARCTCQNSRAP
ncbi:putative glycosyl transferase [Escherichia coli]|uniref:Putative glycosyl transferase n=1 Tax=Escherichia coli TaxID=562 RepID=A0A377BP09_ECOLX|nr:putative glycosyl transferase [Escherichia coli]